MMSRYDEDLYENPFFIALEKKGPKLFEEATVKRWIVCIPQFSMVTKDDLKDEDFKDHILVPVTDDTFQTVSKHEVFIKQQIIELGKGFSKEKKVEILFEETFYNNNDESYRVLCVSEFFNREPEASLSDENPGSGGSLVKQPITYEDYMKLLWTNTTSKTKENLDKLLHTFCNSYEKFEQESIPSLADFVSAQLTRAMQVVLKDPSVKRSVKLSDAYMVQLKVAVEMHMMNITHKQLFSTITACVKSSDAEVNKVTRNLKLIRLKQLGVRKEFEENLPLAKMELAKLNKFSTPLGRLFCLKKVVTALTRPLKNAAESQDVMMTTDDFLPLLIYLIIKSEIPNWTANLMYMKHFHQSKVFEDDEFSFYLATTEAALDYLCSGKVKMENTEPVQKKAKASEEDNHSFKRQGSGGTSSAKDKFFQYVQYGDETAVTLMLRKSTSGTSDVLSRLCHPLCTCDKCSEILSKSKHSNDMVSPYSRDDMGHTALHIAAMYGQAKLIDILIQHGSLPDATDYLGCTPLHLTSQKGYQNIILLLVHFGADISAVDNEGNTPLHMCAMNGHEDCVKAILFLDILKNKLNVNAKNDMGNTPLHLASKWGYEGIVKFLLDTEADPRIRNRKRQTPLNLAQNSVIKRELQLAYDNLPPTIVTHKENQKPTHPKPPPQPPPTIKSPTISSVKSPKTASIKSKSTKSPSTKSVKSPVTRTVKSPVTKSPGTSDKESSDVDSVQKPQGFEVVDVHPVIKPPLAMIDNSSGSITTPEVASLDTCDLREVERLFKAIKDKDLPLIKYYLNWVDVGAESPDSPSPEGTMCHPLCQCAKCQLLQKKRGSNLSINCQNKKGFAPLHIAIIEKNTEAFQLFLKKGAKVNIQTNKHITPLHLACYHCSIEMVRTLIQSGADVNIRDMHGEIALHLSAAKKSADITQLLIQHSSLVNIANKDGNTPLHHACNVDSLDTAKVLIDGGAEISLMNKNNEIPADLTNSEEIKQFLESYNKPLRKSKSFDVKDLQAGKSKNILHSSKDQGKSSVNVKDLFAALEEKDLSTLQQITTSIKSFDKEKSLKRSKTFDRSALTLDLIKIPMSIQHFDHGSLRHVDSVDKSSPMHIYQMLRSESSYFNYSEPPVNVDSDIINDLPETDKMLDQGKATKSDNSAIMEKIHKSDVESTKTALPNDILQTNSDDDTPEYGHKESVENLNSEAIQGNSEASQGNSEASQGNSEACQGNSEASQGNSEVSQGNSEPIQGGDTIESKRVSDQGSKGSESNSVTVDKSQALLNGSYIVVTDSSDNIDNPVSVEMDNTSQTNTSGCLNTDSNISQLLADYDKISIDSERVLEKQSGNSAVDIDGISMCSNLTTEEVVIGSSQSDVNNDIYQKVVSDKHNADKGDQTVSEVNDNQTSKEDHVNLNREIDDVDENLAAKASSLTGRTDVLADIEKAVTDEGQFSAGDDDSQDRNVESQNPNSNDISKMIDDALLENNIDRM